MLDQGRVRITPPAGWMLVERKGDGLSLRYELGDGQGTISIIVTPQEAALTDETVATIAKVAVKELRDAARNEGAQLLIPPRTEPDGRFLLKVRARTRGADGKAVDQLQMCRALQLELVHVAVVANVETEAESAKIFAIAEELLDKAKLGTGPKPTSFRKTRVRMTIPPDWVEDRKDDPNGIVATYTNPAFPGARLVVRSRIIPKGAKRNTQVQDNTLDQLVDDYRNAPLPDWATERRAERKVEHPRFKRYVQHSLTWNDEPWGLDFRGLIAGDVAIGVEALVPPRDDTVTRWANAMALSIRSLDDKRRVGDLELSPAVEPAVRQMRRPSTARSTAPSASTRSPSPTTTSPSRTTNTPAPRP
ncbi:MAG: hypothetical protein M3478_09755 [Planctomycetota bacterium]|nr:hypothetical protein [Planctomycetota bacterium]